ncbi:hypothetical protein [Zooshikella harenae]|uniref:hypothetical protein n=1 Tax=Zooshikella harenae TaxID=2827238 RepID=UPI00272B86B6|nr:hypothetical protein [Zooshikella harenae]
MKLETTNIPTPQQGEVLLQTIYLSLDSYIQGMVSNTESYRDQTPVYGVMDSATVSRVVSSQHPNFQPGEWVLSHNGWQDYAPFQITHNY